MIKKKAKGKTAGKKSAKRKRATKGEKENNPAKVRKQVSRMVESQAGKMAQAAINEGKKGQLANMRYLFELSGVYPPATDGDQATADEDCLAKTLLHRLNLPEEPIARDEEDEPAKAAIPAAAPADEAEAGEDSAESKNAGGDGTEPAEDKGN